MRCALLLLALTACPRQDTCTDVVAQDAALYATVVPTNASACTGAGECADNHGACLAPAFNITGAAAYATYLASTAHATIASERSDLGCDRGLTAAVDPSNCHPACVKGRCVNATPEPATCEDIDLLAQALLASMVDASTALACKTTADCVLANTGSFCDPIPVSRTGAAQYASYLASPALASIEAQQPVTGCGKVGKCATPGLPVCTGGQCATGN
jgi:hypothetical protein